MDTPREKAQDSQIKDRAERKKKQARSRFGLSRSSSLFRLFTVLGPGLIAANAGNDAGGIATFSQAGASYQYSLLWALAISGFCLAIVQEMCARHVWGLSLAKDWQISYASNLVYVGRLLRCLLC
jgi:Mn2+/Fe2+ NRAMP family transporter